MTAPSRLTQASRIVLRRQIQIDQILDQLDATIRDQSATLAERIARTSGHISPILRAARIQARIDRWIARIMRAIAQALVDGIDAYRRAFADLLPDDALAPILSRLTGGRSVEIQEAVETTNELARVTPGTHEWLAQPLTPARARRIISQLVFRPLTVAEVVATWRMPPQSTTGTEPVRPLVERLSSVLWPPAVKMSIESQLVTGYTQGETVEQVTQRIRSVTSSRSWIARRIARTEGRLVLERDHLTRTLRAAGDMIVGLQIHAVLDDRTRPEHRARNGRVYRRQADGRYVSDTGEVAPDLPDAPNCRCTYVPIFFDQ